MAQSETAEAESQVIWPELDALLESGSIAQAYAAMDYAPFFLAGDAGPARALLGGISQYESHGLPGRSDLVERLSAHIEGALDGAATAEGELAFADAYLEFANAKIAGILTPSRLSENIHVFPNRPEAGELLSGLMSSADPVSHIMGLAPDRDDYRAMQTVLTEMQELVAAGGWAEPGIASGSSIELGDSDARVPQIRARLISMGDLEPPIVAQQAASNALDEPLPGDDLVMDEVLEAALKAFQRRHGLNDDGVIGPRTLAALNTTAEERLRQILVNLERSRWTDWSTEERHIYVNLADFRMWVREGDTEIFTTRVVVGQNRHQTVEFSDVMNHMVINPTWTVPRSIATEEILPRLKANPNYLNENNMILIDDGTGVFTPSDTSQINWDLFSANFFPWWIRQGPGPNNALGHVKFMFPNQFAIYLHDTPSRSLFARDARAFSHGCVRVADPQGLARVLLAPQTEDPDAFFAARRATGRETRVNLEQNVPVHLDYRTVWVDEAGQVQYRDDVYGRDRLVFNALQAEGVTLGLQS
ncbi:L,D-transpeptidase family protein [Pontivivens insulae]|nr:L,D-transpeptidase family protein [Pontivivens insulae]